jgi:hypothetical protein
VDTGMSWPSYTYLARTPTRLAFPCAFHPKSGVFTSASLLTHYNYICHPQSHPFPTCFYRADVWCFPHAVTCNKIFVFPVAKCDIKKMFEHFNAPVRDCRSCSRASYSLDERLCNVKPSYLTGYDMGHIFCLFGCFSLKNSLCVPVQFKQNVKLDLKCASQS